MDAKDPMPQQDFGPIETDGVQASEQLQSGDHNEELEVSPAKRIKLDKDHSSDQNGLNGTSERRKGIASIKAESVTTCSISHLDASVLTSSRYLIVPPGSSQPKPAPIADDDAAEASARQVGGDGEAATKSRPKNKGQNTARSFGSSHDSIKLCTSVAHSSEFSPKECSYGKKCRFEHDLRKYLKEGKREDLKTLGGMCPVWQAHGTCNVGWKCRFVGSHSQEREDENGRKELILVEDPARSGKALGAVDFDEGYGMVNVVSADQKIALARRKTTTPKTDAYMEWLDQRAKDAEGGRDGDGGEDVIEHDDSARPDGATEPPKEVTNTEQEKADNRAQYIDPPFRPSEKRRIYYGPETPVLAPLTTQGNLPFRRLCVDLGAQVTWSEMAVGMPLIKGERSEWALMKAHESEILPPKAPTATSAPPGYDNAQDLKFGAQIAAAKPWVALKATEVLTTHCPYLRAIDLNCGCPIDLIYRQGAGSALLDSPGKLERILRAMTAISGAVPVTAKIRMGTKDNRPTAYKLAERLVLGGADARAAGEPPPGIAALTLHGRSRQQRYTRHADWAYISECAALIRRLSAAQDAQADTVAEPDPRDRPAGERFYFVGNGDCFSHVDYYTHIEQSRVDAVMVARGALIKPWIFEEIEQRQYLDKTASERLGYVERFVKYGLEAWGSDERGVGTTRRFLLEWLSFACRYVPVGILEHLPPHIQDRPPAYRGRNELETLLSSDNYKDWIKIRYYSTLSHFAGEWVANYPLVRCFSVLHTQISDSSPSTNRTVTR